MSEEKLMALPSFRTSDAFSAKEKRVLELADAMSVSPAEIDEDLFGALRSLFSDEQIVELASAIAWENYRARFNRVFRAESENFSAGAFCPIPLRHGEQGRESNDGGNSV